MYYNRITLIDCIIIYKLLLIALLMHYVVYYIG
nr:MAG TPA: hypothetical protein [Caudoviricetes sp.]